jgi:hypothetical protein
VNARAAAVPSTFDQARSIVEQLESAVVDVEVLTTSGPDSPTGARCAEPPD